MLYAPSMGFAQKFQFVQDFRVTGYPIVDCFGISHCGCCQVIYKDRSFLNFRRPLKD